MTNFLHSTILLFALLNPFLMSVYLLDLIDDLPGERFARVLIRGSLISLATFSVAAWLGEALFDEALGVSFASFQVFGGLVFVLIGVRFTMQGSESLRGIRGQPEALEGSVALPFMIGPGTLSASIVVGERLPTARAVAAIALAITAMVVSLIVFKAVHDRVRRHNARLIHRYVDIVGRASALYIGTVAVQMILAGLGTWSERLGP